MPVTADYVQKALTAARQSPKVVYDTETDGLDWKRNKVVGYVLTVGPRPDESFYLPVRHGGGANVADVDAVEAELADIAKDPNKLWVGHNMKFDMHMSANHGILFAGNVECTQVNMALINENSPSFSLDGCCTQARVQAKKGDALYAHLAKLFGGEPARSQMANYHKLAGDDPTGVDYALGDGTSTWQLHEWQGPELDKQDLRLVWSVERRVLRTLFNMERHGVRIDLERLNWLEQEIDKRYKEAVRILPEDFNPRSPTQVRKWLEHNGVTNWPTTAKGAPSFPEAFLLTNEPGQQIIAVRKLATLQSSFIQPMKERHLFNGRVYTNFNQLATDDYGTVSGRLSSNEPNLQQVPKRDKTIAPLFRSVFLPEEGHQWSVNDFFQQDLVVFAHYTKAQTILDGYHQEPPIDIHQTVANWLGVERDPTAKRMNLGLLNGMGAPKLALSIGQPESVARQHLLKYDQNFPEAKVFRRRAEARAKERGYVFTLLGRRRHFPDPRLAHKAGSAIVQGGSADLTKLKMVECDEYLRSEKVDATLLIQIHDDLDFTEHPAEAKHMVEIRRIMTAFGPNDVIQLDLPMRVDVGIGSTWAEATFPKQKVRTKVAA